MKKLLYIVTIPDWGGAQRYIFDLAKNLKNDFDITVAFGRKEKDDTLQQKCEAAGIKTHAFKNLVRPISPINDLRAIIEIKKYIKKACPDILHLNSSKAGVLGSFATNALRHKPRTVYTVHGWVFFEPMNILKKNLYIFLEKSASRFRDLIIVLGEKEKNTALQYKIAPEEKFRVIRHAVSKIEFLEKDEARNNLDLPNDKKIFGTIANFFAAKGLRYLVEAAIKTAPEHIAAIIGDGPLKEGLENQIKHAGLQNKIMLLGARDSAAKYLKAFDAFVLPSVKEGLPYVILEAMQAGVPIIATDVGNVKEMLAGYENKIIVAPGNADELSEAMNDFAIRPASPHPKDSPFSEFIFKMKNLYLE